MNQHAHQHPDHHHHNPEHVDKRTPIQKHGKWFVLAVVLMLIGIFIYNMTDDEALAPAANEPGQVVPAAP